MRNGHKRRMRVVAMTPEIATNVCAPRLHWPVMRASGDKLVMVINVVKCLFSVVVYIL